jgi:BarA-like signal transduction histidine kinase
MKTDTLEDRLARAETEFDVCHVVQTIINSTSYNSVRRDAFFERCEEALLMALFLYLPPESRTFSTVCGFLLDEKLSAIDSLFKGLPTEAAAGQFYLLMRKTGLQNSNDVIASVGIRLRFLQSKREASKPVGPGNDQ